MKKGVLLILLLITTVSYASAFEFCDDGTVNEDTLRIISVDDMLKDNSQEWQWESLQNIELEIRVENKGDETKNYILEAIFIEDGEKVNIAEERDDLEKEIRLSENGRESVSLNFQIDEDIEIGNYELYIKFYEKGSEDEACVENSEEETIIEKVELCEDGNVDKDDLEITKITDEKYDNEENWNWAPGNEIEISVDISNKEYSERNFIVELIMLDKNKEEVEFSEDETRIKNEIEIEEDAEETIEFNFKLNQNIEEGTYTFYTKIYDEDNDRICTILKAEERSSPKDIKIKRVENNVIVTEITGPKEIQTNSEITYTLKILNIGSEDEEKVSIIIYNRNLGLKEITEIEDLKSGQETEVTFNFQLSTNATLGKHKILFTTEFKYDNKRNAYKKFLDKDDEIKYYVNIIEGVVENTTEVQIENITENEIIEEIIENTTIIENVTLENEDAFDVMAPITGNIVGTSKETSTWPIAIGLLFVAIIGIFLYLKRPKSNQDDYVEYPVVNRRYTASLD